MSKFKLEKTLIITDTSHGRIHQTRILMGMPITVEIIDKEATLKDIEEVFSYFDYIDHKFSPFKDDSEVSKINRGEIKPNEYSEDMKTVLELCQQTKEDTDGYFEIEHDGKINPSGLVKGWAIRNATIILKEKGFKNFYVDAGGDIEISGFNSKGNEWQVGIRNPFDRSQNIKILSLTDIGIATSGTVIRGQHIYDPYNNGQELSEIVSLTVIGPNVYEADRFATAAFAMQNKGIELIQRMPRFACYMIDRKGIATFTENFNNYLSKNV